jgi:hypothetical protein
MSYVNHTLHKDETVVARGRLHWIIYRKSIVLLAICAALIAISCLDSTIRGLSLGSASICGIFSLFFAIPPMWRQLTTEIAVTNKRLIVKHGFINRHTAEMSLANIESTYVDQNILGRILNYGTIHCRGSGDGLEHVHDVKAPIEFRSAITAR